MDDRNLIIKRLISNSAEVITPEEFKQRLSSDQPLTHYIGFEISGYVHIGQGIMSALVIKDLQALGVKCTIWLADWHTWINDKLDGTKATAQKIGTGYFTEALTSALLCVGADPDQVEFRLASDWYARDGLAYMETLIKVARHTTLARALRSVSIMGREAGENIELAKTFYPAMQAADIFYQNIDIAHAAMDQRKAHVVMRDVADHVQPDKPKPIALHHPLIDGLTGEAKMSKSKPDSAVFIHDEPDDIHRKINKAYCQEKDTQKNPILNWTKNILFWNRVHPFVIERKPEHGGTLEFSDYSHLEQAFAAGELHPMDLKAAVAAEIVALLAPARSHFAQPEIAAKKAELDKVLASR